MNTYEKILEELKSLANPDQVKHLQRFFKTGIGDYGEGDLFLGLKVPTTRAVAKKYYSSVSLEEIEKLIQSPHHETRLVALLLMVFIFEKDRDTQADVFNLYIKNVQYINNWDLVDLSCSKVFGRYVFETKDLAPLYEFANSNHLWSKRISVVSTYYFIKRNEFELIIELAEKFLTDKHDLMQKAVGWMLREMGKMDVKPLYEFLDKHHKTMPRTMLRYSIEKLPPEERKFYMS